MKTELIHSYSTASLAAIARSDSAVTFTKNGELNVDSNLALEESGESGGSMMGNVFRQLKYNLCRRKTVSLILIGRRTFLIFEIKKNYF